MLSLNKLLSTDYKNKKYNYLIKYNSYRISYPINPMRSKNYNSK